MSRLRWRLALPLVLLGLIYLTTLQSIPNGSVHYTMIDVGETQAVLNLWGTLHATGYPLYVITGNLLVGVFKLFGISAVTAPALVSLFWALLALGLLAALALRLSKQALAAACCVLLFGLTRTVWIHAAIAEIYSFGLLLLVLLYVIALWPVKHRILWLALIGGIAVSHHRAFVTLIPALLYAVLPDLNTNWRRVPRLLILSLLLGLIGFLPYIYLPLRDMAGAAWVYGQPGSWGGFWDQFWGVEASRFIGPPDSLASLWANMQVVNEVLITDLSAPGLILGLTGLLLATGTSRHGQTAKILLLGGLGAYLFHVLFYSDVLSALILQVTLSIAFGWCFWAEWLLLRVMYRVNDAAMSWRSDWRGRAMLLAIVVPLALLFAALNWPFIQAQTSNPRGEAMIAWAANVPTDATLMLPWGTDYFAVGVGRDVQGKLPGLQLVDHNADFESIVAQGRLVTAATTFYNQAVDWWQARLGSPAYLRAAGPEMVEIATAPLLAESDLPEPVNVLDTRVECHAEAIILTVDWAAGESLDTDWSVFVHLLNPAGDMVAQADQSAPVYGWRPTSTWQAGEIIPDVYSLPRRVTAGTIRYGLYRQLADGSFRNDYDYEMDLDCS